MKLIEFNIYVKVNWILYFQVECTLNTMWGVDKDNTVWFKNESCLDKYLDRELNIFRSQSNQEAKNFKIVSW